MVKVDSSAPVRTGGTRRTGKKKATSEVGAGFSAGGAGGAPDAPSKPSSPQQAENIKSIESLVSLQDVTQNLSPEQKSYRKGAMLLDRLEILRNSLLSGSVSEKTLAELKDIANENHKPSNNPELEKTRRLIEQRVNIELAKLGK